jgi:uncharacterized membrane protein (DUF441 family)
MAPIASGTLPASTLLHSFVNWKSLVAIAVGIFVAGRGVTLMSSQPCWWRAAVHRAGRGVRGCAAAR